MGLRHTVFAAMTAAWLVGCGNKNMSFQSVNPPSGRLGGGEEVRIRGGGFDKLGNLEVRIGGRPATNVGVQGEDTIVLTTPEGREGDANHPVDISILTSEGRSIVLRRAFTYQPGAAERQAGPNEELRRRL